MDEEKPQFIADISNNQHKRMAVMMLLLFVLCVSIFGSKIFDWNSSNDQAEKKKLNISSQTFLKDDLLVFARCFGSDELNGIQKRYNIDPDKCLVYQQELGDHESLKKVATFTYQKEFKGGNIGGLRLIGSIKENVIFTNHYYDKPVNGLYNTIDEIGYINLRTGRTKIIDSFKRFDELKSASDINTDIILRTPVIDAKSKKIFYQLQSTTGKGITTSSQRNVKNTINILKEYSFVTNSSNIIGENLLGNPVDPDIIIKAYNNFIAVLNGDENDNSPILLDVLTKKKRTLSLKGKVTAISFTDKLDKVVYGTQYNGTKVFIVDLEGKNESEIFKRDTFDGGVTKLEVNPEGKYILVNLGKVNKKYIIRHYNSGPGSNDITELIDQNQNLVFVDWYDIFYNGFIYPGKFGSYVGCDDAGCYRMGIWSSTSNEASSTIEEILTIDSSSIVIVPKSTN